MSDLSIVLRSALRASHLTDDHIATLVDHLVRPETYFAELESEYYDRLDAQERQQMQEDADLADKEAHIENNLLDPNKRKAQLVTLLNQDHGEVWADAFALLFEQREQDDSPFEAAIRAKLTQAVKWEAEYVMRSVK